MTSITGANMLRMELRAACSQDVIRLLFGYVGVTATEEELLTHIKSVAVKGTHKEIHCMKFFQTPISRVVDDSLLWDLAIGSSFWHTFDYLKLSADNEVVFKRDKFQFTQEDVSFAGFEMTREGCKQLKKIITAIKYFSVPTCITDVRSWFGFVNQLS